MAPQYKLIYLDAFGRAECARYLMKYGNIEFEDVRISREDWPQLKNQTPFGQIPVLEYKGIQINQSSAINRYLAHVVKLSGENDWEDAEIDAIVDTTSDIIDKIKPIYYEQDEDKKKILIEKVEKETIPFYLSRYEEIAKKNNGYLAVGRLTWADLQFACYRYGLARICKGDLLADYPTLKALIDKVEAIPAIKEWIAVRPKTAF